MGFRKEKKFQLSYSEVSEIKKKFFSIGMIELYPSRVINSIYFDNKELRLFRDSEEGVVPRKKIRIRWYENDKKFTKEVKISSIEGRYKHKEPFNFSNSIIDFTNLSIFDQQYGILSPLLNVKYEREYYSLKNIRITFDRNISYSDLQHKINPKYNDNMCVMEIKAPVECSDDYIGEIFHNPTSRFSKYCRGLLHASKMTL